MFFVSKGNLFWLSNIAPDKTDVLLLIRSASARCFWGLPETYFLWRNKKIINTFWLEKVSYLVIWHMMHKVNCLPFIFSLILISFYKQIMLLLMTAKALQYYLIKLSSYYFKQAKCIWKVLSSFFHLTDTLHVKFLLTGSVHVWCERTNISIKHRCCWMFRDSSSSK